jgi:hypothetical protein
MVVSSPQGSISVWRNQGTAEQPFVILPNAVQQQGHAPVFADLDGDGCPDIVARGLENRMMWLTAKTNSPFCFHLHESSKPFDGLLLPTKAVLAFADIDRDGDLDAIVGGSDRFLGVLVNTGTPKSPQFFFRSAFHSANPFLGIRLQAGTAPTCFGNNSVVISSGGVLTYFEASFSFDAPPFIDRDQTPVNLPQGGRTSPTFHDVDGDGQLDLIMGHENGTVSLWRSHGAAGYVPALSNPFRGVYVQGPAAPALADLDGNGNPELVVGDGAGQLSLWARQHQVYVRVGGLLLGHHVYHDLIW